MFESSDAVDPAKVFPDLAAAIAALPVRAERGGSAIASGARVRAALALARQIDAVVLAEVAAFDDQAFAAAHGCRSTGGFLAAHAHLDPAAARRIVLAARTADRLPQLGSLLAAGQIGVDHVAAVAYGAVRVPQEILTSADDTFADLASTARPAELRLAAQRLQACYDQDATAADAGHVEAERHLSLVRTFGDAWHLEGLLTPEDGASLRVALDSLMAPRGEEDDRTPTQRRADALVELTQVALRSTELPESGGDRPRVTYLIQATAADPFGLKDIAGASTGSGPGALFAGSQLAVTAFGDSDLELLGSTALLPAETVARICCDADLATAVLGPSGQPLHLGRTCRDPNIHQRRMLVVRDKGCVFPGCDVPPQRCQAHHVIFWRHDGRTDICNLALVCSFHHHLVHEGRWTLAAAPPSPDRPAGGWTATAPDGRVLFRARRQAA
ncbi:HNH endonuclease signature motif containing protein [Acidothermaceae bacterium B102]|nr:HNH endonuclease signature motif containing protein [Acidothermaceae bacterium B102]